jgi:hypothetical protein
VAEEELLEAPLVEGPVVGLTFYAAERCSASPTVPTTNIGSLWWRWFTSPGIRRDSSHMQANGVHNESRRSRQQSTRVSVNVMPGVVTTAGRALSSPRGAAMWLGVTAGMG